MIVPIVISTMIIVAVVVFAMQYRELRKEETRQGEVSARRSSELVGRAQEAPISS